MLIVKQSTCSDLDLQTTSQFGTWIQIEVDETAQWILKPL